MIKILVKQFTISAVLMLLLVSCKQNSSKGYSGGSSFGYVFNKNDQVYIQTLRNADNKHIFLSTVIAVNIDGSSYPPRRLEFEDCKEIQYYWFDELKVPQPFGRTFIYDQKNKTFHDTAPQILTKDNFENENEVTSLAQKVLSEWRIKKLKISQ